MSFASQFFEDTARIAAALDKERIEAMALELRDLRERGGRLFLLGVGGSAGNCGHAVNDFRKLCGIEAYAPTDNVSELTARANDEGWDTIFSGWLAASRARESDAVLVLSVGGGDLERNISPNLVRGVEEAKRRGLRVLGIVGRESGYTQRAGDCVLVIPALVAERVTPFAEAFQGLVWHCLVSHPALQTRSTKWELAVRAAGAGV